MSWRCIRDYPPEYHFLLHYLKANGGPIELKRAIRYLEDWDVAKSREHSPYVERGALRNLFTQFKTDLAVKGMIVIIESSDLSFSSVESKFERFSFYLPEAFLPTIPALPVQGKKGDGKGVSRSFEAFAKNVLLSSLGLRNPANSMEKEMTESFSWKRGIPYVKERPVFRPGDYTRHIYAAWCSRHFYDHYMDKVDIAANVFYIMEGLPEGEWTDLSLLQDSFGRLTRTYNKEKIEGLLHKVCDEAALIGWLEKTDASHAPSYRLHTGGISLIKDPEGISTPVSGISMEDNGSLRVDPRLISLIALFDLLLISEWTPSGDALLFSPSPVKLGKVFRAFSGFSELGIHEYLVNNAISYKQAFQKVESSFGECIIHSNLSIFEIADITISAFLTHTFPETFLPVGGDFFAVSERDEGEIIQFLEQKRYSIRIQGQGPS